jgi:hypothetical protein
MSQFPAQIAFTQGAQGARRNAPVDIPVGTGIPAIQPANVQAPGIPNVAILPTPVPDFSAARDLEQALRATNALGRTLVDVGNAVNIQRQIDERQSVYQARLAADKAQSRILLDFQEGKLNPTIDATDDMEAFVSQHSETFVDPARQQPRQPGEPMTMSEAEYAQRVSSLARQVYVKRRGETQKLAFQDDVRGVHAELVDPTTIGPPRDADTLWNEFSTRYPWLDRATFMEATYGKAGEALAKAGDADGFSMVESLVTDPQERTIYVDPLRETLRSSMRSRMAGQMQGSTVALKEAQESNAPIFERHAKLRDRLETMVEDPAMRESTMIDFFAGEVSRSASLEDMNAAEAMAKMTLTPEGLQDYQRRKGALMGPVLTKQLKALATMGDPSFPQLVEDAGGAIDPDDLATAQQTFVRNVQANRKSMLVTEYMKTRDAGPLVQMLDESLSRWDPAKPAWQQVISEGESGLKGAIDGEEYLDLMDAMDKVDADRRSQDMVSDVIERRVILQPGDPKWADVMSRTGAVQNGKIVDPAAAASVVAATKTVPSAMLDALYADLRGTEQDKARAIELLAGLAPMLADPAAASQINGMNLRESDAGTNAATIQAINSVLPMLATMERGQDGRLARQDAQAATQAFQASLERWQDAQAPAFDAKRFEDLLRASKIDKVLGITTVDGQTNTVTINSFRNALKTSAADRLAREGLSAEAAVELADVVSADVLRQSMPAIGNSGMSKEVIEQRVKDAIAVTTATYHLPKMGGRGFPNPTSREIAPNAEWDEAAVTTRLGELGIKPENVTHVQPAIGEGNSWWILVQDGQGRGRRNAPSSRFVQVDFDVAQAEQPLTLERRIEMARERRSKSAPRPWYAPVPPIITGP